VAPMTDPSNAMRSFQEEHSRGRIQLQRGAVYPDLYMHFDEKDGKGRFSYVTLENRTVTAFVNFVLVDPIERKPCFSIGYAVPEAYRNQGRAKEAVGMALAEMQHGLARGHISTFYVEAIIGADNKASQRVAEQAISPTSVAITDQVSGLPALQYVRKIERPASSS
jgi:RimJ/RimL family protein N-acetyltransferase